MSYRLIDPNEKLDFSVDWNTWLDSGVSVTGPGTWSIDPTGPTLGNQVDAAGITTIFVSGCTLGQVYLLTCQVTTDAATAQIAERTITLRCENR